jgi:mono/diheme cytochrome c family protein
LNEQEKRKYLEEYKKEKEKGVPFFPDIIFKDTVVMGLLFAILVGLVVFVGVPSEPRADPTDASYLPRPEWYFLWVFQLLKYFPGSLEVLATSILPVVGIVLLLLLPFYDRGAQRHPARRPLATGVMSLIVVGMVYLTWQATAATPPSEAKASLSPAAVASQQYTRNCAPCHGSSVKVRTGTDLHKVIAEGLAHEGMPAWGGDFSSEEIDQLVNLISAPDGAALFRQNCTACHELSLEVPGGADELHDIIAAGAKKPPHEGQQVADWGKELNGKQINALVNFVLAPKPRKLYDYYCAGCHGSKLSVAGVKAGDLRKAIERGGKHRAMPAWKGKLTDEQITTLASYIADPSGPAAKKGKALFEERCSQCHGDTLPADGSVEALKAIIARGGPHQTMPAWGQILSPDEIGALIDYILAPPSGAEEGKKLFSANCSGCHGKYGEGGPNPTRPGDIIPPISSSDFLSTRDDETIHAIISMGQPNLGMVPFGTDNGGPLDDEQIDQIVAYMRTWETNPPVGGEAKKEATATPSISGEEIFTRVCAQCHGENGTGTESAPALNSKEFLAKHNDAEIRNMIRKGLKGTSMWAWGDLGLLSDDQINGLVSFIRQWEASAPSLAEEWEKPNAGLGDAEAGQRLFAQYCSGCHGVDGEVQVSGVVIHDAMLLRTLSDGDLMRQIMSGGKQMPAFHSVLTRRQGNDLLAFLRTWQPDYVPLPTPTPAPAAGTPESKPSAGGGASFSADVKPILDSKCAGCHGPMGGWSATDYTSVINSGDHGPVIIPGDPDGSLLVQKLKGTQSSGGSMPPGMPLSGDEIDVIVSWVQAGAPNN